MTAQPEDLGALKARVDLVAIVRRHVDLKRRGRDGEWGRCPLHGEKTPSFKVGASRQTYHCFGCGAKGDAIDFVAAIERVSKGEAIKRLREIVGDEKAKPARPAERPPPPDARAEKNRERAQEIWRQTETVPDGLPFDYLTRRRGITVWDGDRLRWHPACPWQGGTAGCIVACVNDHATSYTTAIWRIRPTMDGPIERRGLGPVKHNAARLFWASGNELLIAEGVEDALAAHALTGLPAWAALSAGNMAELILPERFREVTIFADADTVGIGHAAALARRLQREGRVVRLRRPRWAKDANDILLTRRAG
jgi:DNA primase